MKPFSLKLWKFYLFDKYLISGQKYYVSIPILLNIFGETYNLNTSVVTPNYVFLKIYMDDFDIIPEVGSNIMLFITMNIFTMGLVELSGKVINYKKLSGKRLGLWIVYEDINEKDQKKLANFLDKYYSPRYSVSFGVDVFKHSFETQYPTQAVNLSYNGIFIEGEPGLFDVKEKCYLHLHTENQNIEVMGEVTWINKGKLYDKPNGFGIKFIHNKYSRKQISNYVKTLTHKSELIR